MPNHAQQTRPSGAMPAPHASGANRSTHQTAQLSAIAAQLHAGARQAHLAGLAAVVQRVPIVQRNGGGIGGNIGGDTGADNDAEFYLYQQRQQQRREAEAERRREREEREARERREAAAAAVGDFKFRFYDREYEQKAAIIAKIVDHEYNPYRANYGRDLIDRAISTIDDMPLPPELLPEQIINSPNAFKTAVKSAYDSAVKKTDGKTDTLLGLHATYVNYS